MSHRIPFVAFFGILLLITAACTNKKSVNPLSNVGSKQPDKVLFDKAMDAMKHNRFDVARITLQTLINTYPDSEFIARAKLAVGDSWYAEGGTASLAQAEQEYRDFITFFPNMPEAAEAQLKIANIQYQQMEKPDRDYTHAKRAEEEYRSLILQFPRECVIGRFYYLRPSYPAAIARLRSLVERYPLYSHADEALYLLGQTYEGQMAQVRSRPTCTKPNQPPGCIDEGTKARMLDSFSKSAADAYAQIIKRYPIMDRVDDARKRLAALHQPIPRPTKAAVAQNKAEDASRRDTGTFGRLTGMFMKHPDVAQATKVGDPALVDPTPVSATEVARETVRAAMGGSGEHNVSVEKVEGGTPPPNEAAPRSDTPPANSSPFARPNTGVGGNDLQPAAPPLASPTSSSAADPNELKPDAASTNDQALPPPAQVNEIQQGAGQPGSSASADSSSRDQLADDSDLSSSKKKKKKGLKKIVPF
jgi:outer membrane protein assembly factor BamD